MHISYFCVVLTITFVLYTVKGDEENDLLLSHPNVLFDEQDNTISTGIFQGSSSRLESSDHCHCIVTHSVSL